MKYEEILPAVAEGKWYRLNPDVMWVKMDEEGTLFCINGNEVNNFQRHDFLKDTWEVKPKEIILWCVSHKINDTYDNFIGINPVSTGLINGLLISVSNTPLFSINTPTKYKPTPLED